jgi:hypothetical protein
MKKFLMILAFLACIVAVKAETAYYQTTEFAYKSKNTFGFWGSWTDWESSSILVVFNSDDNVVTIHSPSTQVYRLTGHVRTYKDNDGGKTTEFTFVDQDGDRGHMRLRITQDGTAQLYIDFNDIMWVYNLVRL